MKKSSHDTRLRIAKQMPPLRRTVFGENYDVSKDEVLLWIKEQPELLNMLADKLRFWGCITFDRVSGTWRGVDYDGD